MCCFFSYLHSLEITILLVTVQDYVIGHAETFSHSQVIEEGRLAERVTHLNHCYICGDIFIGRVSLRNWRSAA